MGGCKSVSNNKNLRKINEEKPDIGKFDVLKVKPIPQEEKQKFVETYISDIYIHPGDEEFEPRLKQSVELMYKRWDWFQANKEIYVNMLREKGFSDQNIQDCIDGKRPLCYSTREIYADFCNELAKLKINLEKELGIQNVHFVQTGSSTFGYSSNPHKGLSDRPSKITNSSTSDVDIVIFANGIKAALEAKQKEGAFQYKEYPSVIDRDGKLGIRYGNKKMQNLSHFLNEWLEKWVKFFEGKIQITFQEEGSAIPPWELPLEIPITN